MVYCFFFQSPDQSANQGEITMNENDAVATPKNSEQESSSLKTKVESYGIRWSTAVGAAVAVGALLVVCLLLAGLILHRNAASAKSAELSAQYMTAQSSADLQSLLDGNQKSSLAPVILLKLAQAQFAEGGYDRADASYRTFLDKYPNHSMARIAEMGTIFCAEASGPTGPEKAHSLFMDFAARHTNSFLLAQAIMGQARCLEEMSRWEEAKQVYEEFLVIHTNSAFKTQVEQKLRDADLEIKRAKRTL